MDYKTGSHEPSPVVEVPQKLPKTYGEDTLVLMARDPWWAYAYWEITEKTSNSAWEKLKTQSQENRIVLRVYDITGNREISQASLYTDYPVGTLTGSWYLQLDAPHRTFVAEIGYLTQNGNFFPLVRSNVISLPRADIAGLFDSEWMVVEEEFTKIYRVSGAGQRGPSSQELLPITEELRRLISRRMKEEAGSAGLVSSRFGSGSNA